jgi:predicted nucleic acid-binding Zn ribbon protein
MPKPQKLADIMSELITRRGYARVQATASYDDAWREAAGDLAARYTRVVQVRRGLLEVIVANSTLVQELTFQKRHILKQLTKLLPEEKIVDLRLRVGPIE